MSIPRKMPGCAKITRNNKVSLVVAGGQNGRNNNFLKSVEIIGIDIKTNSVSTWVTLGEMNFARAYFPSVGFLNFSLVITAGKLEDEYGKHSVEKYQNGKWKILDALKLRFPRFSHSTVSVTQEWCKSET